MTAHLYNRWAKVVGGKWNPKKVCSALFLCLSVCLNLQKQLSSKCILWTDPIIATMPLAGSIRLWHGFHTLGMMFCIAKFAWSPCLWHAPKAFGMLSKPWYALQTFGMASKESIQFRNWRRDDVAFLKNTYIVNPNYETCAMHRRTGAYPSGASESILRPTASQDRRRYTLKSFWKTDQE